MNGHLKAKRGLMILLTALMLGGPMAAWAAEVEQLKDVKNTGDFDLGPTSFEIEADPGQTVTKKLQITNRAGEQVKYSVDVEDFQGTNDDPSKGVILQGENSGKFGAKSWVKPELSNFTLEHGQREHMDITVVIPENADPGDHYASVLIKQIPKDDETAESDKSAPNVKITSRVGALMFIKVRGAMKESGSLVSFGTDKSKYEQGPVKFGYVFKNDGTIRLRPTGKIEISNQFGNVVDTLNIDAYNVLRDSTRRNETTWDKQSLFGHYTAKLTMNRGYGNEVDTMQVSFWVMPWKKAAGIGVGLVIAVWAIFAAKAKFASKGGRKGRK